MNRPALHPNNEPEREPESESDVFDMERAPAGTGPLNGMPAPAIPAAATPRTIGASGLASKIRPVHFAILSAVLAAVWIFWPDGSAREAPLAESNSRLLSTQLQLGRPADQAQPQAQPQSMPERAKEQRPPQVGAPARAESTATDAQEQATLPVSAQIVEQQAQQAAAIVAAIDTLNLRLAALEMRQAAQSQAARPLMAPPLIQTGHAAATGPGPRPRTSSRTKGVVPPVAPTLTAYALNTIFPGQAWVQHAERMYVVQEGDMIDELKIIRIDPEHRQVLTSRGIIR